MAKIDYGLWDSTYLSCVCDYFNGLHPVENRKVLYDDIESLSLEEIDNILWYGPLEEVERILPYMSKEKVLEYYFAEQEKIDNIMNGKFKSLLMSKIKEN